MSSIICPHCSKSIPLTDALEHQSKALVEEKVREEKERFAAFYKKRLKEETEKQEATWKKDQEEYRTTIEKQISEKLSIKLQDAQNAKDEMGKQLVELRTQLLNEAKERRVLLNKQEEGRIEFEKRLAAEQERIRSQLRKQADEEFTLKMREKDYKLEAALKINEELKKKLEQGSQQAQGEVLELELEESLRREFPIDTIEPVAKGVRGADLIHTVNSSSGRSCGTIIWETKRTKHWGSDWVAKLKDDQRRVKAEVAILVSEVLPQGVSNIGFFEGVWVCEYGVSLGLAIAIRSRLLEVAAIRTSMVGKNEKMEVLYRYLSGTEFRQRVEVIVETFRTMQEDIKKERSWFMAKWARQEKSITKVIDTTFGMQGDLQSIIGNSFQAIDGAEPDLPPLLK